MAVFELLKEVAGQHLLDTAGLWALIALIPLILVYLIRPRPKKQTIPALMFLIKESAKSDKTSFLRRFIKDPLFLFQILMLIAFAIAISKPYIITSEDVFVEKTAIVIDMSASMQTDIDGSIRFDTAIKTAKENLGETNVIVLMGSVPELAGDDLDSSKAKEIINSIEPKDTPTNVFDSIIFAGNYVKEKDRIVVISDFIDSTSNKDYATAKNLVESKGIIVDLINVRELEPRKAKNIGIIGVDVNEETTSVQIKNFNDENESITVSLDGAALTQDKVFIESKAVEVVTFPTVATLSKFSIETPKWQDEFSLDNHLYLSTPSTEPVPLLLISNIQSKHLATALDVIGTVTVDRGIPPKVPEVNHNIIVLDNVITELILPGVIKKVKKQVEDGGLLVIFGQEGILSMDFLGLLPVERADSASPVLIKEDRTVMTIFDSELTQDMNFGRVSKYLNVKPKDGSTVIAATDNDAAMIVMKNYGKGMVLYVGMMDDSSTFKEDIYYPIFWKRLFDLALKKQDLSELNFKTGRMVNLLEKQDIVAPKRKINADTIMLDHQGIYRGESRTFVANLLNEEESNINGESITAKKGVFDVDEKGEEDVKFELTHFFIIAVLLFVFLELLWIKFRGDL